VLLLSTDPAHSLADVLGCELSDVARAVPDGPPNLHVRELDASRGFERVHARYEAAVDALFERITRGSGAVDAGTDRAVMHGLIDLAPPGVDELAAVIDITDALDDETSGAVDLIVMDTAPSGHALRLLEMPAIVQDWAKGLMSIVLKYQSVVGVGELGAVLLALSRGLGRLRALLTDPDRARFVAVTRAAALPRAETGRLLKRLASMRIDVPAVIVNAAGRGTCSRCRTAAAEEARELAMLTRSVTGSRGHERSVIVAPAEVPSPHGVVGLSRWGGRWRMSPRRRTR
jgi:arsenite-transporting ATPase